MELNEAIDTLENQGYRVVLDEAINNPDEPASKKQLWALFCITKQDWRDKGLTKGEASELIQKYSNNSERHQKAVATAVKKSKENAIKRGEVEEMDGVKVGDIYHLHWGYSMSINTYYKVIMIKGKKATVVELGKKVVEGCMQMGKVVPDEKKEGDVSLAMIKDGKLRIKLYSKYETFTKWDGKPDIEDHMD